MTDVCSTRFLRDDTLVAVHLDGEKPLSVPKILLPTAWLLKLNLRTEMLPNTAPAKFFDWSMKIAKQLKFSCSTS